VAAEVATRYDKTDQSYRAMIDLAPPRSLSDECQQAFTAERRGGR